MKQNIQILNDRVAKLLELADNTLLTKRDGVHRSRVDEALFTQFKTSSLSFILSLYGEGHPYYKSFQGIGMSSVPATINGRAILNSIKEELDNGWLVTVKGLVSAEIFSNFLEMAEHLLEEGYKDPAAVMVGSVLEEHLRQLCTANSIAIEQMQQGKLVPKKADALNSELASKTVYNKLDQKAVTTWLDLRNKAAHGKYTEYTKEQVELMMQGVSNFMVRNALP